MTAPVIMTQTSSLPNNERDVLHLPFIQLEALAFNKEVLHAHYDWIIFSSKNAVKYFKPYFQDLDVDYVAAIGEKTCRYCSEHQIEVDFFPGNFSQEGFLEAFHARRNSKIIIPSSAQARPLLADGLKAQGVEVVKIDLYQPEAYTENIEQAISLLNSGRASGVAFASASAAEYFFKAVQAKALPVNTAFFAIGRPTLDKIKKYGYTAKLAETQTIDGLLNIIKESRNQNEF